MSEFVAALVTTVKIIGVAFFVGASVGVVLAIAYVLSKLAAARRDKREREEREARRVIAGVDLIKTQPSEPPDDDELIGARPVHIARSPLADTSAALDRAELATAAARHRRPVGAHRADGDRDPRLHRLRRDTEVFAAIAEAESGEPLAAVGPREKNLVCRRIAWTPAQPIAEQLALDFAAAGTVR